MQCRLSDGPTTKYPWRSVFLGALSEFEGIFSVLICVVDSLI